MNTNKNLQRLSNILRFIAISTVLIMNLGGALPANTVRAQDEIVDIYDDDNGTECSSVGAWDNATKTCQLTQDVYVSLALGSNVTLDGNRHSIIGPWQDTRAIILLGENITIQNITVRDFGYCLFSGYKSNYLTVTDSIFENCGMGLSGNNIRIEGNHISGGEGRAIEFQGSDSSILRNMLTDNSEGGILMHESDNNLISENDIRNSTGNSFFYGIMASYSDGNVFENNNIENVEGRSSSGIQISFSAENTVRNNFIAGATYGLNVDRQSTFNVFYGNLVQGSWLPLTIGESTDNQFYDNDFIDNGNWIWVQPGNIFQLDLPIGGNYWSTFDDRFEGCLDLNLDGLCDSPYVFDGGQDNLPWTRPDKSIDQIPVAEAGEQYSAFVGEPFTLDASASSDPDADPLTYEWDLDNDGTYDNATGVTTTTTFNQAGEYTIGMRVTDLLGLTSTDTAMVTVTESLFNPWFYVWLNPQDGSLWDIHGYDWPLNTPVTMTLDNPSTPESPDYTRTAYMEVPPWGGPEQLVFDISGMTAHPGDFVTMTDGNITLTHTVTSLRVNPIDLANDIISGTAEPGSEVSISVGGYDIGRTVITASDGAWVADFSQPGNQDEEPFDIQLGMKLQIGQDNGSGTTAYGVNLLIPGFEVVLGSNNVNGWDWPMGATVTIEVDDPATPLNPDYQGSAIVGPASWDPNKPFFEMITTGYDLKVGDIVTVTDGASTKTTIIAEITINFDVEADIVSGTTTPDAEVAVISDDGPERITYSDSFGNWSVDFSVEQDGNPTLDLIAGSAGVLSVKDNDGDRTYIGWRVPNPNFVVRPLEDFVDAWEWPNGASILLTLDDPNTPQTPDYTETEVASYSADWRPEDTLARFINGAFDIQPGQVVTLTDGITTRTHTVTNLAVTGFNVYDDTIYGTADPFATISNVNVCDDDHCSERTTVADEFGNWVTDFSVPGDENHPETIDIRTNTEGIAIQNDEDGDATHIGWEIRGPLFMLNIYNDSSWRDLTAWNWPLGSHVTLTVDDPNTPQNPDYTETRTPHEGNNIYHFTSVTYDAQGGDFIGHPGVMITLSDGILTKSMIVPLLTITGYDLANDTISGVSDSFLRFLFPITHADGSDYMEPTVVADSQGNWSLNLGGIFDLRPGDGGEPQFYDSDRDHMVIRDWAIPEQPLYSPFVVFGQEGVWIKENTDIISGDVAANIMSEGPYLTDQSEVTIGQDVHFMDSTSRVLGDTVYLKQGSRVYDIFANQLKGNGQILGIFHTPLPLPIVQQLPATPDVNPGTQNFILPSNGMLTLNAGNYSKLEAKKGSTITFTGGVYHFSEWTLGDNVKVYFTAPTEIRIVGKLDIGTDAFVGPLLGAEVTAHDIFIYVLGENGSTGKVGATPKAAKFGIKATLNANVYTPNGTLWIRENSKAAGAFFGKWVEIGQNVTLTLDNGWR